MFFTIFDLVVILALFLFIAFGFVTGFIQAVGALVGVVVGAFLAGRFFDPASDIIAPFVLGNTALAKVLAFIILFTIFNRLIGLVFYLVDKAFGLISIIPFTKSINRLLGGIFGLIEGILAIGLVLYVMNRFAAGWVAQLLSDSTVAGWFIWASQWLTYLLPDLLH